MSDLSTYKKQFLIKNNFKLSNNEMMKELGISEWTLYQLKNRLGLDSKFIDPIKNEEVEFLKNNYKEINNTDLANIFNEKFPRKHPWNRKKIQYRLLKLNLIRDEDEIKKVRLIAHQKYYQKMKTPPKPKKQYFQLDSKTRVVVKPGTNIEQLKERYEKRHDHLLKTSQKNFKKNV